MEQRGEGRGGQEQERRGKSLNYGEGEEMSTRDKDRGEYGRRAEKKREDNGWEEEGRK